MYNIFMPIFTAVSCVAAIISVIISFKANKKNQELTKQANRLSEKNNRILAGQKFLGWSDIEKYVDVLVQKMKDDNFTPTVIYFISVREAFVANMIAQRLIIANPFLPLYTGARVRIGAEATIPPERFEVKKHTDWGYILIPKILSISSDDKILIVDDYSGTGTCFSLLSEHFISIYGLKKNT